MTLLSHSEDNLVRCPWPGKDELYIRYHDEEWGLEVRGDQAIFERLTLEGFQAGLSWITILKRRETFRVAFRGFDLESVAAFDSEDVERLMNDPGIIRNRLKVLSAIKNAQLILQMQSQGQSISDLIWSFAPPAHLRAEAHYATATVSPESEAMSKTLKKLGFGFVGPTTMFALMQAIGLVDGHSASCFKR
jgi:DNA-3-methyladenine glycosylase I